MFELTVELEFASAHRLPEYPGPCARLHGHNYRAVIAVRGEELSEHGMLMDFGELKKICREVVAPLDHGYLNEQPAFAALPPTAEAIARHIYQGVSGALSRAGHSAVAVAHVSVYESGSSCATYRES